MGKKPARGASEGKNLKPESRNYPVAARIARASKKTLAGSAPFNAINKIREINKLAKLAGFDQQRMAQLNRNGWGFGT
jgi:hypothetical protein